jgi:uncharacterized protein (DUF433 family)
MMTKAKYKYISRNTQILDGEPVIKGTRTPVREGENYDAG